jgi:hypothetical protein
MQVLDEYATSAHTSLDDWLDQQPAEQEAPANPLDSEQSTRRHGKLVEWLNIERQKQGPNRYQMALDHDFYDGLQWAEEDIQELVERNQAPLVYNMVKPTIDWVTGTEKRTRVDFKVLPREAEQENSAQTKTKVLKYLADVNRTGFARSRAFSDAVKGGVGWLEDGVRHDDSDEPIFSRYESWRNIIYDSSSVEPDLSDARYLFRWKWIDLDIALVMFPDRQAQVRAAAMNANRYGQELDEEFWYLGQHYRHFDERGQLVGRRVFTSDTVVAFNRRSRVKLIEGWYRVPVLKKMMRGDEMFDGQEYQPNNPDMRRAVENNLCTVYDAVRMQMRMAIFTDRDMLHDDESPYRHNRFPFTPIWCHRRNRDNAPYGIIRNIRDPQEDLNKRMSKAQFILASNQVVMEEGAVADLDELASEVSRPNGIIVKKKGKELEINRDNQLAQQHIELAHFDAQKIQDAGGITDEQMGRATNAQSGRAIEARQLQGSVVTAEVFDNLRMAFQMQGELQLSLVEQFMAMPKQIRLTGSKGKLDWVQINQPQQNQDGSVQFLNDITEREADFIVDEQDFHATLRQAMFSEMMDLVSKMPPDVGLRLLDLVIEFSDVPNKDEIVARIRKITGEIDPNAKMSPEEMQAQAVAKEQADQAAALQQKATELDLAEKQARVEKLQAEAQKALADARSAGGGDQNQALQAEVEAIRKQAEDAVTQAKEQAAKAQRDAEQAITEARQKYDAATVQADADSHAAELRAASEETVARIERDKAVRVAEIEAAAKDGLDGIAKRLEEIAKAVGMNTKTAEGGHEQ